MKKFLLSIFAVLLAIAGVQAEETASFTVAEAGYNNAQAVETIELTSGVSVVFAKGSNSNAPKYYNTGKAIRCYGGNTFTVTSTIGNITKIELTFSSGEGSNVITAGVGTYSNGVWTGDASSVTFTIGGTSGHRRIAAIAVTYTTTGEGGGTEEPVAPAAPTLPAACNFDDAMTVEITDVAEGATAYYSLNDENNWVEGTSVKITETTTVYAKVVKDELSSDVVSETYTKNAPVTPPAEGEVIDVINIETIGIDSYSSYTSWTGVQSNSSAVYAGQSHKNGEAVQLRATSPSGIISTASAGKLKKIVVEWASNTTSGRTLNVYGKNTAYSATTDLYSASTQGTLLGTIVCGTSTELVIEGDYEYIGMCSSSGAMYLTSISITWDTSAGVTPVVPNAPVLPASTTFKGSMMVEITGFAADATVYYTTDGTDPSITNGTKYTESFEITTTTTVKAVAVNEVGASEMATAIYTLFVVEETTGYYVKVVSDPADWSGKYLIVYEEGTDAYVFNGKDEANGYVSAVTDGDVIKANSEIDAVAVTIATMEGGYSIKSVGGYIAGKISGNGLDFAEQEVLNTLECTTDGVVITSNEKVFRFNAASNQMRFRYYGNGQKSVQLYKYVETLPFTHTLTVAEAGYATLYLGFNARIPSAVEAYTVTAVNDGWASLTQVTGILPAQEGIIVKAPAGDYKFFYEENATADVAGNLLEGTLYDMNISEAAYVLSKVDGEVGLYKAKMIDGSWSNNANKAYLPASAVPNKSAEFYGFDWNGTTGIDEITEQRADSKEIYDLTGRKVNAITAPGIYIVGGKKVLVK